VAETLVIVNPNSARGRTGREWPKLRELLERQAGRFVEHITDKPGDAVAVTREHIRNGTDFVVAVGGDGTLNEVVNGYLNSDGGALNPAAMLGLLPSGTGSDFSRSLGWGPARDCVAAIARRDSRMIDAAVLESMNGAGEWVTRYFVNAATFGLGGDTASFVNEWRDKLPRWIGGRPRFALAVIRALARYKNTPVRISIDGNTSINAASNLLVVGNGRFAGGGMMLAPDARFDDGAFDLIIADGATRLDVIRELPRIRRGKHLLNPRVRSALAREVAVESAVPMAIEADGEPAGVTPARIRVLPGVIRFIC
jgi:YegS/Rv2252/BmrU family lipid kinase